VTAAAAISCSDPARLARAMARHFGHKVPVEETGGVTRITLSAGRLELEPDAERLAVRASAAGAGELADVQRIAGDHLARFARPEAIAVSWAVLEH
jgi:uncharacterized protein